MFFNFCLVELASYIAHEDKKSFCLDTSVVFHAEFARLISFPISLKYPGARYYLFVEDAFDTDPCTWANFSFVKLDNAKAQFRCSNPQCSRLWTSMRARISFKISIPNPQGFVVLKIYRQQCQSCNSPSDALWYMGKCCKNSFFSFFLITCFFFISEEVCRVMENLSKSIFDAFYPSENLNESLENTEAIENSNQYSRRSRHDPQQRKGKMHFPHNKERCEACQRGWCFA